MNDINETILNAEKEFEIKALEDEIENLRNKVTKLEILLKEAGSDYNESDVSDEETVCVREINRLLKISEDHPLSSDDVKKFDILNKNLQLIRGNLKRGKKSNLKDMSSDKLKKMLKK